MSHFLHFDTFVIIREDVRNLTLGYPSLTNRNLLGEIHKVNSEILGYPRIPGSPLTTSLSKSDDLLCPRGHEVLD